LHDPRHHAETQDFSFSMEKGILLDDWPILLLSMRRCSNSLMSSEVSHQILPITGEYE
jgi:hypothetical protein